jgi:hypothetical protein
MSIAKICLPLAVLSTPLAASVSFAEDGGIKINAPRAGAIRSCSMAAAKFPDYSWGNTEMFIYRACMNGHRQQE